MVEVFTWQKNFRLASLSSRPVCSTFTVHRDDPFTQGTAVPNVRTKNANKAAFHEIIDRFFDDIFAQTNQSTDVP